MGSILVACVPARVEFYDRDSQTDVILNEQTTNSAISLATTRTQVYLDYLSSRTTTSTVTPTIGWLRIPSASDLSSDYVVQFTTPIPSWTPQPTAAVRNTYRLRTWDPDLASDLVKVMEEYPENLTRDQRGYLHASYEYSFRFAAITEMEAAYRFPTSPHAKEWITASLYNRLRSVQPNLGVEYGELIVNSLNNRETDIETLPQWFFELAQPLRLEVLDSEPPKGYSLSKILFINPWGAGLNGGLYIWLLQKDSQFVSYPLDSAQEIFMGDGDVSLDLVDLTGDGVPEAVVRYLDWRSFNFHSGSLEVFDLTRTPPVRLDFYPNPAYSEIANWLPAQPTWGFPGITMQIPFATESTGCGQFGPTWIYHWTGDNFVLNSMKAPSKEEMDDDPRCADEMLSWFLLNLAIDGNEPATYLLEQLLDGYPRSDSDGSQVSHDQLGYEMAIALAYHGKVDAAIAQLGKIIDDRGDVPTIWFESSTKFLNAYQQEDDLLRACLLVNNCSNSLSVEQLVSLIDPADFPDILQILNQLGLGTSQSGAYDFDRDGQLEYWLYEYQPYGVFPFWIFSLTEGSVQSLRAAYVSNQTDHPKVRIQWEGTINGFFQYKVVSDPSDSDGDEFFYWNPSSHPNVLTNGDSYTAITRIFIDLLSDEISPQAALAQMDDLRGRIVPYTNYVVERFGCEIDSYMSYVTALSYEMEGQVEEAARRYWDLWHQDPQSPYAIMARAKLEVIR
jgi:hypothetical protein